MAKKKPDEASDVSIDELIEMANKEAKLVPSNLNRGELVKQAVSTGSLAFDLILGGGWSPRKRSNVFGREQSGKSLLVYSAVKSCIDQGIAVVFYDWEGATDGERIERMGIRHDWAREMKKKQPVLFRYYDRMLHGQQMFSHAFQILDALPDSDNDRVRVAFFVDSLPAVLPRAQAEDNDNDSNAQRARLFSNEFPKVKAKLSAKGAIWIDTNQLRNKVRAYGNPEYEPCGEAVKFFSDCRVKAKKTIPPGGRGMKELKSYIEEEPSIEGGTDRYNFTYLYVDKNKAFSAHRSCTLRMWFESNGEPLGILDPVYDVYEYLRLTGQIKYYRKEFTISLAPFDQEREVVLDAVDKDNNPVCDPTTGEVQKEVVRRSKWTWAEFKALVLQKQADRDFDIAAKCRAQLADSSAFTKYFEVLAGEAFVPLEDEAA